MIGMTIVSGPVWTDGCDHPKGTYVGSFITLHIKPEIRQAIYDLYVFNQPSGESVCIRYGNEPQEYYSPGPLVQFVQLASRWWEDAAPHYVDALEMLKEKGVFSWRKLPTAGKC